LFAGPQPAASAGKDTMIIVLKPNPTDSQVQEVEGMVRSFGYEPRTIRGVERTVVACVGDERQHHTLETLTILAQVEAVIPIQKKYKLVSRESRKGDSVITANDVRIGNGAFHVIAGPCSVESLEQTLAAAHAVKKAGATLFRAGAYKPRTSPYDFQGLGKEGLEILKQARAATGLGIVTEVMSPEDVELVAAYSDVLQIGTRNAQNTPLLTACARTRKPVLLKRGFASTIQEWLLAAEYVCAGGNEQVILCERGIRTFETATRNTLDVTAIAMAKKESHLPVFVDPSHAAGRVDMITPLAKAGIAAGADGMLIEVHPNPAAAWSDGAQQLKPEQFVQLMKEIEPFVRVCGKRMCTS
jgi:3-deoxy-7-phosphoheptulonate synthase